MTEPPVEQPLEQATAQQPVLETRQTAVATASAVQHHQGQQRWMDWYMVRQSMFGQVQHAIQWKRPVEQELLVRGMR